MEPVPFLTLPLRRAFTYEALPPLRALPTDYAGEVLQAIARDLGMPLDNIRVSFGGQVLHGRRTLQALEICDGATLDIACQSRHLLVVGYASGIAKVWDYRSGHCIWTLRGHTHHVTSVACSMDGGSIATGSHDGTVKIWNAEDGLCSVTLDGQDLCILLYGDIGYLFASWAPHYDRLGGRCRPDLFHGNSHLRVDPRRSWGSSEHGGLFPRRAVHGHRFKRREREDLGHGEWSVLPDDRPTCCSGDICCVFAGREIHRHWRQGCDSKGGGM